MRAIPVLVTSVGGNVGQGVVKALRAARQTFHIIGVDMEPLSAGFSFVDAHYTVPRSGAPGFHERLVEIHRREQFEAIYVCSHAELDYFAGQRAKLEHELGASVFANPPGVVATGRDKLRTAEFLKNAELPYPQTVLAADQSSVEALVGRHGFPVILKPRIGASSLNVIVAKSMEEIAAACTLVPDLIAQQHLPDETQEYTAGTVSDYEGKVRASIVLRRDLLQGTTYRAELVQDDRITRPVVRIVEALGAVGPCNVQFRLLDGVVYAFEINPRFSGTSGIRYLYGFNDAELVFELLRQSKDIVQPRLRPGVVLRHWDAVHIAGASFDDLRTGAAERRGALAPLTPALGTVG
jgi:carbamoyl-phosphate synthase large subunit